MANETEQQKAARTLVRKETPAEKAAKGEGSYIRLEGSELARFKRIMVRLGHDVDHLTRGAVKSVGDQVASFGMDTIESMLDAEDAESAKATK
jgi:hypothetical protein